MDPSVRKRLELQPLAGGLTVPLLRQAIAGLSETRASAWVAPLNEACRKYDITRSLRRMAAFLGHIAFESGGLRRLEENMNYKDAHRVNAKYGAIKTDKEAEAYLGKPEALANKVYANKNGNRDEASGDGWTYRGRGLIQLTFRDNYKALARDLHAPSLVDQPNLLVIPQYAALSAAWFWHKRALNDLADAEMYERLSLRINKKLDSFPAREANRRRALEALCRAVVADTPVAANRPGI